MDYDAIGKTETFDEDAKFVLDSNGLADLVPNVNKRINATPNSTSVASNAKALQYFSQLTQGQRTSLFRLYELDFEMFGYSAEEYLATDAGG